MFYFFEAPRLKYLTYYYRINVRASFALLPFGPDFSPVNGVDVIVVGHILRA